MAVTHVLNDLADLRAIVGEPDRPGFVQCSTTGISPLHTSA